MTAEPDTPFTEAQILAALRHETTEPLASDDQHDLADAVEVYRTAGRLALQTRLRDLWLQVHLRFPDWSRAEAAAAHHLVPALDQLHTDGVASAWWYLRKYPHWRLRCRPEAEVARDEAAAVLGHVLDDLVAANHLRQWRWGHYEPEALAFGSHDAMDAVHAFFHVDSASVLAHARRPDDATRPGRRELSVLLCTAMLHAAELDQLERADVWDRVAASRQIPEPSPTRIIGMAASLHRLLYLHTSHDSALFTPGGPLASVTDWADAFRTLGRQLAAADRDGTLHRGLREVLATVIRHHWNRLGLADHTQGVLARAIRCATMTPDHQPSTDPRRR